MRTKRKNNTSPHACNTFGLENSGATGAGRNPSVANTFPSLFDSSTTSTLSSSSRMGDSGVLPCIEKNPRWIDATRAEIGVCSTSAARRGGCCWGVGVCGSDMTIMGSEGDGVESSSRVNEGSGMSAGLGMVSTTVPGWVYRLPSIRMV